MRNLIVCVIFFLLSAFKICAQDGAADSNFINSTTITKDFYCKYFDSLVTSKKLPIPRDNVDSIWIRLWEHTMFSKQLTAINFQHNCWWGYKYDFINNKMLLQNLALPGTSPRLFLNEIKNIDFDAIPDQLEIQGMEFTIDDGVSYTLEIKTNNKYYHWRYENPAVYAAKQQANKKISELVLLIERFLPEK